LGVHKNTFGRTALVATGLTYPHSVVLTHVAAFIQQQRINKLRWISGNAPSDRSDNTTKKTVKTRSFHSRPANAWQAWFRCFRFPTLFNV